MLWMYLETADLLLPPPLRHLQWVRWVYLSSRPSEEVVAGHGQRYSLSGHQRTCFAWLPPQASGVPFLFPKVVTIIHYQYLAIPPVFLSTGLPYYRYQRHLWPFGQTSSPYVSPPRLHVVWRGPLRQGACVLRPLLHPTWIDPWTMWDGQNFSSQYRSMYIARQHTLPLTDAFSSASFAAISFSTASFSRRSRSSSASCLLDTPRSRKSRN